MRSEPRFNTEICAITARAVDPDAVRADIVRRVREAHAQQVARACNAERVALGQPPEFDNPNEARALRPLHPFGVAVPHTWHACFAYANGRMKQGGTRTPCSVFRFGEPDSLEAKHCDALMATIYAVAREQVPAKKVKLRVKAEESAVVLKMLLLRVRADGVKEAALTDLCLAISREVDAYVAEYARLAEIEAKARELAATLVEEAEARHAAAAQEIRESVLPAKGWIELLEQEDTLALVH